MPRFIIKLDGKYLEWSTIVDAPVSHGMTREKFDDYYRFLYGNEGMKMLPERMSRVETTGTSSHDGESVDDMIDGNRAGENERELSKEELIREYCGVE